jgi:hypothetical protein
VLVVPSELDVDEGVDDDAVGVLPASVGAAVGVVDGVDDVVEVAEAAVGGGAAIGFWPPPLCMPEIVMNAYTIASANTTPRRITIFFCFACLALAASATVFFATCCSFRAD